MDQVCEAHEKREIKKKKLLLRLWVCGREASECGQAVDNGFFVIHGLSTRPAGRWLVR